MITRPFRIGAILAASAAALAPLRAEPGHVFAPLTPAETAAIAAAVPSRSRVAPARPRAILVFYRTEGYVHTSIPYANEALRQIGARTGAYRADFSEDMSVFTPERLAAYDAVVFQNTTGLAFKDPAQRAALLAFVRSGKGLVGIHAATDSFYTWPEAREMIGGAFLDHPWKSIDTVAIKVDEPGHPVVAAFGGSGFWLREEIYQITGPYRRDRQRVLLSLDMSIGENRRPPEKITRTDADFPIAWVKGFGRGRVFYTSLGHNPNLFSVPELLQFYLDGIQFAIGDLPAESAPLARPPAPARASIPGLPLQDRSYPRELSADAFDRLAAYNFGPDRVPVVAIDLYLRAQGPAVYPAVERSLIALLARPALPAGAKDYAIRTLGAIGSPASVPVLDGITTDARFGPLAVMALFSIPGPESAQALLGSLGTLRGQALETAIGAVGRRHLVAAIPSLAALASSADHPAASAALTALGAIGTPESLDALTKADTAAGLAATKAWAQLDAARHVAASPSGTGLETVEGLYRSILASGLPDPIRVSALSSLVAAAGPGSLPQVQSSLHDLRPRVRSAAANLFAVVADRDAIAACASGFHDHDPVVQVVILDAFDSRRAADGMPLFKAAMAAADPDVRVAALRGLGDTGLAEATPLLINRLAGLSAESAAAADSLGRLRAPGVVTALLASAQASSPAQKALILQILGGRADHRVYPLALAAAGDPSTSVRTAAFAAIAATSRPDDLPTVLALLPRARTAGERRSMERALLEAVRASPNPDAIVDAINRALARTRGPARYSLLTALALAGTDHARAILGGIMRGSSAQDRREAIRAIAGSRNPRLDVLLVAAARGAPDPNERILALRSYLDLLQVPSGRSADELAADYATAWSLAGRAEEQDAILAALLQVQTTTTDAQAARLEASRARH